MFRDSAIDKADHHHTNVIIFRLVLGVLIVIGTSYLYEQLQSAKPAPVMEIQEITLIEDIPEPEEPEEPEPIIEEPIEEMEIDTVEMDDAMPDDMPPAIDDTLGLDGDGEAGGDNFGLAAKKGGRSLIEGTGGSDKDRFAYYAGQLEKDLLSILQSYDAVRMDNYNIEIALWIDSNGYVEQLQKIGTGTSEKIYIALKQALTETDIQLKTPPQGMKQPIRLRIRSVGKA